MWADSDYAQGRGSFLRPVNPPSSDPDAAPTISVAINCEWIPFILGALQQLTLQATWKTADPSILTLAQMRAMTLMDIFMSAALNPDTGCPGVVIPFSCGYFFELTASGWAVVGSNGAYQTMVGYRTVTAEDDGGACLKLLDIEWFPPTGVVTLTDVHVVGFRQDDAGGAANGVFVTVGGVQSLFGALPSTAGPFDVVVSSTPVEGVTRIVIDLGTHTVPGGCSGSNPNFIQQVDLHGSAPTSPCG